MLRSDNVIIKGVREGLLVILDDDTPYSQILTEMVERINAQPNFFQGAAVVINAGSRVMERPEFEVLYRMLTRNGMKIARFVSLSAQSRMVAEGYGVLSRPPSFAAGDAGAHMALNGRGAKSIAAQALLEAGAPEVGTGLFLRCNLRPGQTVRYEGDVCVLGDVETGAELVADGDVVVWGALRGLAHAGAAGDDEAVVCALEMLPTQIAIAGVVSRYPASASRQGEMSPIPELARLERGHIVVEAWTADPVTP